MRFRKILRSPTSTNHSLNARSPLVNDERSFAVSGRSSGSCNVGVVAGVRFELTTFGL
jgi:hypothetical protein